MKKIYLVLLPCLLFMALAVGYAQNITNGGIDKLNCTASPGWQVVASGVEENLLSVHFANNTYGFIGGALTRCLKSGNSGISWDAVSVPSYADFDAVFAATPDNVYLGGWDTVYATSNGGQSWEGAYTQTINYAIHDLQFLSPQDGFAFMTWAQMGKTTDGGNSWSLAPGAGFTAWDFFGGFMLNQNTGWAVGDNQLLCKTTDGGENFSVYEWNGYSDFTGIRVWSVQATSELNAWAVADSGVVFRTTDGGNYWSRSTIAGQEDNLTDIYFINENTGYIVGYNGKIFKTTDGGNSWIQEPQLTDNHLNAVFFISENLGWAVGDFGTILRYWIDDTGLKNPPMALPTDFSVSPNPVHEESSVLFELRENQNVKIEVRDISDRALKIVFDGSLTKGEHAIRLDLPDLNNGVYYCILSIQGEKTCKPFLISR